jgi:hypothetical protein
MKVQRQGEHNMHTAICAFSDRETANRAIDRLLQSGFARQDVHLEHREAHADGTTGNTRWDGMEREVAVDPSAVTAFGRFFASLFGQGSPSGHVDTYSQHVDRGGYVVVVDGQNDADAARAQALMREMEAGDVNLVQRQGQRPLREIVADRGLGGTAGMVDRSSQPYEGTGTSAANLERERALAAGTGGSPRAQDPRDDLTQAPGLRYSDKDRPLGS